MTSIRTSPPPLTSDASTILSQAFAKVALVLSGLIVFAAFSTLAGLPGIA